MPKGAHNTEEAAMKNDITQIETGKRIAECRRNVKLTQEELADRIGITAQALSQYERGLRYPDMAMLKALCIALGVSSDYLLGLIDNNINETADFEIEKEIWHNLRNSLAALSIVFGEAFIPCFSGDAYGKQISDLRLRLSREGILMPVIRIRDWDKLHSQEFLILAHDNVLYHEEIGKTQSITSDYVIQKLEDAVRQHYAEIITIDMVKDLVENLSINHSAIMDGVVPELVSYGQLLAVCKGLLKRGDGMVYLPRIVEMLGDLNRMNSDLSDDEIIDYIAKHLETSNNIWVWLHDRNHPCTETKGIV